MEDIQPLDQRDYTFFKLTQSTCPECLELVQTKVIFQDEKVYHLKFCKDHGESKALVSEDAEYYRKAYDFVRPGRIPKVFDTPQKKGCPQDCGLCPDHQQHTCLPIVEITDHCNLECPICLVNNQNSWHMEMDVFKKIVQQMIDREGYVETITFSGGEPTIHPQFLEMAEYACSQSRVGRVSMVTNGLKIAQSKEFCEKIEELDLYTILQMDGFTDQIHQEVRGKDLQKIKMQALENLAEFDISTQISFVPVPGVNDHELGKAVELLVERDHILSLMIQPVSYTGKGGGCYDHDPLNRITIPGVIKRIADQSNGFIKKDDFSPLPCSHPLCVGLTYLLRLDNGEFVPFPRFMDIWKCLDLFEKTATINVDKKTEEVLQTVINDIWANNEQIENSQMILKALKRALLEMYPGKKLSDRELTRISERQAKTIFIHHYMDRHNFDLERLVKCCHHYPLPDGKLMPICSHNMFHRGVAKG